MAASNTSILIKRSTATGTPSSLKAGELAYSYLSNTIFIGNSTGTGVVNIGGQYYTSQIDNASSANGSGTIVKRDAMGNISVGYITAAGISVSNLNANTANLATYATQLQNPQYFGAYGDATAANVIFNGTANVELGFTLATVNSNVGAYGNTTSIPTITVDAKGRITSISNNTIATSFTVSGNTGSGSQQGGGTLTIEGNGTGITTTVTGSGGSETVLIATDNTVLRSNTSGVGPQTIGTDLSISGNLIVSGTTTYVNTSIIQTNESVLHLAANNTVGDVIDIGFVGDYNNGSSNLSTGLIRDAGSKNYYLFANVAAGSVTGNTIANNLFTQGNTATLYTNINGYQGTFATANITNATVGTLSLTNALAVGQGGTGQTTFAAGEILIGNGSGALQVLANTGTAGTYGNSAYIPVVTTDAYGRVSGVTNTAIAIAASQITSGQVSIAQGGTNNSSYVNNEITYFNGSSIVSLANTGTAGTYGNAAYIPVVTTDGFGRVSGVSNTAIAIPASQLTNGTTGSGAVVLAASPTLTGTTTAATLNVSQLNVTTLNVTYSNVNSVTANSINIGSLTYAATGAFVAFGSNANNYQQVVIENANTGTQASADFIVSNLGSSDTNLYGDFGINGINFSGAPGALNVANNVYLYSQGTDLAIGTGSSNAIHFVVNSGATDAMTIAANGYVSIAQALATVYGGTGQTSFSQNGIIYGNGTGALQVTAAAGGADQTWSNQILTVNNTGVPTWTTTMDGGSF